MTMANKEDELCLFLDSYINFELAHYSHPDAPAWQKYEQVVGSSIIYLLCLAKAATLPGIAEKEIVHLSTAIRIDFLKLVTVAFKKTKAYTNIKFGNGITNQEKESDNLVLAMFQVAISRIGQRKFILLFKFLVSSLPEEIENISTDFKTILQEYFQKNRLRLPSYEIINIDGLAHDQTFHAVLSTVDGNTFKGSGTSKKKAEINAAAVACNYYKIKSSKPLKIEQNIPLELDCESEIFYGNKRLTEIFGLPDESNLVLAFSHPRLRGEPGQNPSIHRKLACVGSAYILYCNCAIKTELFKNGTLSDCDEAIIATAGIPNEDLVAIFESNMMKGIDIPFTNHPEFFVVDYLSDCVQALFGMSFFHFLSTENEEFIYKTPASDWIAKVILALCRKNKKLNNDVTSIALLRYQSLGYVVTRIKLNNTWALKMTHIRTGDEYTLFYEGNLRTRKDVTECLSGVLLKVIDRFEGIYFIAPKTRKSLETHKQLFTFLLNVATKDKKQNLEFQSFVIREKKSPINLSPYLPFDGLIEFWKENTENLLTRAYVLWNIHKIMGVSCSSSPDGYAVLPAVYKPVIGEDLAFNIETENFDPSSLTVVGNLENEKCDGKSQSHNNEINENETLVNLNEHDKDTLLQIEKKYKALTIDELENFWKARGSCFSYAEEAAIVLSIIRFERGIDFEKTDYKKLLKTDMIVDLDLPSFFNKLKDVPKVLNKKKQAVNASILLPNDSSFTPTDRDERIFVYDAKVSIRVGQSSFRNKLIELWNGSCSVSGCNTLNALDAAHISPYRGEKDNDIRNGLLLRADLHRLFDAFFISINPDTLSVHVSNKITDPTYTKFEGLKVEPKGFKISEAALRYHWFYFANY